MWSDPEEIAGRAEDEVDPEEIAGRAEDEVDPEEEDDDEVDPEEIAYVHEEIADVQEPIAVAAPFAYAAAAPVADGAEEEEQQGARASGARASGGRALRSRKVCETEAAGRHVRWQDTSVFER